MSYTDPHANDPLAEVAKLLRSALAYMDDGNMALANRKLQMILRLVDPMDKTRERG
jgi:hypothetical protein